MTAPRSSKLIRCAVILLPLAFSVAGCETFEKLNPFAEQQTPLPGSRRPVFPEGVPGVEFGAPPPQPSNSNIPITPAIRGEQAPPQENPDTQTARPEPQPQTQARPQAAAKSKGNPDDAWAGAR